MLKGKGLFIWEIEKCAPNTATLVRRAQEAGIQHVLIKVSDGSNMFPSKNEDPDGRKEAMTKESVGALQAAGIEVWGWTSIYGDEPSAQAQAQRLVQRLHYFGLVGVVMKAEMLPDNPWTPQSASRFMDVLVNGLGNAGITDPMLALSSYSLPSQHPEFPFDQFMLFCQYAMPQVYWVARDGGDPVGSLQNAFEEYHNRFPGKVVIPTGSAFGEQQGTGSTAYYWEARPDQVTQFINQVVAMDLPAVNFWSWQHAWEKPALWDAIAAHPFTEQLSVISVAAQPQDTPERGVVHAAVGLPDTPDDDGVAIIDVAAPGYQEGIYSGTDAELTSFVRNNRLFTWVGGETERSTAYAQWLPRITISGEYLIEAFIPGENATARRAKYHITGVVGAPATIVVEVNQLNVSDDWARLGFFKLDGGHQFSGMVSLNNLVGPETNSQVKVAFGPIRWTRVERTGILPGYADGFDAPVGTTTERRESNNDWGPRTADWPGQWVDANPFLNHYFLGYHTGVDLNLPRDMDKGAPCYSIASGTVTYAGPIFLRDGRPSGFGNLVIVKHDPYINDRGEEIVAYSRYAHIKDWVVKVGDRVRRGDHLATIWNVGTQAYHLHFDISTSGVLQSSPGHWPGENRADVIKHYVDPYQFIRANRPRE